MALTTITSSITTVHITEWLPRELCEALLGERIVPDGGVFGDLCHCTEWDADGYCRSCGYTSG